MRLRHKINLPPEIEELSDTVTPSNYSLSNMPACKSTNNISGDDIDVPLDFSQSVASRQESVGPVDEPISAVLLPPRNAECYSGESLSSVCSDTNSQKLRYAIIIIFFYSHIWVRPQTKLFSVAILENAPYMYM